MTPIYQFQCLCKETKSFERGIKTQGEIKPPSCEKCGKKMQRIYEAPGIIFKGKGWGGQ